MDFTEIYKRFKPVIVKRLSRTYKIQYKDYEDLIQIIMLRLHNAITKATIPVDDKFIYGRLKNFTRNEVRTYYKQYHREREAIETYSELERICPSRVMDFDDITVILELLPDPYKSTLELVFVKGKSYSVIAEELDITEEAVRKRVERGITQLRSMRKELLILLEDTKI